MKIAYAILVILSSANLIGCKRDRPDPIISGQQRDIHGPWNGTVTMNGLGTTLLYLSVTDLSGQISGHWNSTPAVQDILSANNEPDPNGVGEFFGTFDGLTMRASLSGNGALSIPDGLGGFTSQACSYSYDIVGAVEGEVMSITISGDRCGTTLTGTARVVSERKNF